MTGGAVAGFDLRRELVGEHAEWTADPTSLANGEYATRVYTRGWTQADFDFPVTASVAPPGAVLFSTENRAGEPVVLSVPGTKAVYHDGTWAFGPGFDEHVSDGYTMHWERRHFHSITVFTDSATYGVRVPKRDFSLAELVRTTTAAVSELRAA